MGEETFDDFKLIYCKRDSGSFGLCHMHDCVTWVDPNWCALGKIEALKCDNAALEAANRELREALQKIAEAPKHYGADWYERRQLQHHGPVRRSEMVEWARAALKGREGDLQ